MIGFDKDIDEGGLQASGISGSVIVLLIYNATLRNRVARRT